MRYLGSGAKLILLVSWYSAHYSLCNILGAILCWVTNDWTFVKTEFRRNRIRIRACVNVPAFAWCNCFLCLRQQRIFSATQCTAIFSVNRAMCFMVGCLVSKRFEDAVIYEIIIHPDFIPLPLRREGKLQKSSRNGNEVITFVTGCAIVSRSLAS